MDLVMGIQDCLIGIMAHTRRAHFMYRRATNHWPTVTFYICGACSLKHCNGLLYKIFAMTTLVVTKLELKGGLRNTKPIFFTLMQTQGVVRVRENFACLLYTSDAADD